MAKTFAITTAKPSCTLDASRSGSVSFTVTNTTDKPARGQLKIKPLAGAQASWFQLQGVAERDFTASGTEQVGVKIAVPASVKPGDYSFRLDAISVAEPDDDFTEGQAVSLQVSQAEVKPPPKFPWWILVAIVVVVAIVGGVVAWLINERGKVKVPDVVKRSIVEARKDLEARDLVAGDPKKKIDNTVPVDQVVDQDPTANTVVKRGAMIQLTVAEHPAPPPPPPPLPTPPALPFGPDTCKQGFVWRDAFANDHVCVPPETRAQAARDNQFAPARVQPGGGPFGPNTCRQGFVWREAGPNDRVCVPPTTRAQAATDNSQAASRRVRG